MIEEAATAEPEVEPDLSAWKLVKETLPPGFLSEEDWGEQNRKRISLQGKTLGYLDFLFNQETGIYGNRPGNRWRCSRRKWIERFVWIQDKATMKIVRFQLNEAQRLQEAAIVRQERRGVPVRCCSLKARQHGTSTHIGAVALHLLMTRRHTRGLLMGHKKDSATVIQGRMRDMIGYLRRKDGSSWAVMLDLDNRKEIKFGAPSRSTIMVDSAEGPDYRGDTLGFFHAIEPGDWPDAKTKANAVLQVVPQAAGTYVFIEGTAKGDTGWFAETWKSAKARAESGETEGMQALFFPWFIHQNYRWSRVFNKPLPAAHAQAIETSLDDEERRLLAQRYARRGHGLVNVDVDQLAWRRYAIRELCQGSLELFHQEYPAYAEEAFLSTGAKFFSAVDIGVQRQTRACQPVWRGEIVDPAGESKMLMTLPEIENAG